MGRNERRNLDRYAHPLTVSPPSSHTLTEDNDESATPDGGDLTIVAPDYAEEIEGWGDLETAKQQPEFRANFPE